MKPFPVSFKSVLLCFATALFMAIIRTSFIGETVKFLNEDRMVYGLTLGGEPIGGMTLSEAHEYVKNVSEKFLKTPALIVHFQERTWEFDPKEIGLSADVDSTVRKAFAVGRDGEFLNNVIDVAKCAVNGREVEFIPLLDADMLEQAVQNIASDIRIEPENAWIDIKDFNIEFHSGKVGRSIDTHAISEMVAPTVLSLSLPVEIEVAANEIQPEISAEDLSQIDNVISTYTTYYNPDGNRGKNIRLAASSLDGILLRSGEVLSFNDQVGGRVQSAGYLDAPVIVDGKFKQDVGGGVCQVSSTLYCAILKANLTPTERTSHFYPSSYVPAGLDATVADNQIDFAFKNTLPHNIYILSETSGNELTFYVLGCSEDINDEIALETKVTGPNPTVEAYRVFYSGESEIAREYLHTDEYDVPPPKEESL